MPQRALAQSDPNHRIHLPQDVPFLVAVMVAFEKIETAHRAQFSLDLDPENLVPFGPLGIGNKVKRLLVNGTPFDRVDRGWVLFQSGFEPGGNGRFSTRNRPTRIRMRLPVSVRRAPALKNLMMS